MENTCELRSTRRNSNMRHETKKSPDRRAYALYFFSFLTVSLTSGLVYGWPALRRNLLNYGKSTLTEKELGAIFTVGAWSTHGGRFLFGIARDKFGTKRITCLALWFLCMGCLGLAFSGINNQTALAISMLLVGLGSGGQLCLQPVAGLFRRSGSVMTSLSGAYQISGLIFLALLSLTRDRNVAFGAYSAVCLFLCTIAALTLPWGVSFEHSPPGKEDVKKDNAVDMNANLENNSEQVADGKNEIPQLGPDHLGSQEKEITEENPQKMPGNLEEGLNKFETENHRILDEHKNSQSKSTNPQTALTLMLSVEYISLLIWFSVCLIPLQYYIGSIGFQLERKGDVDGFYTSMFSILYASAAALSPLSGYFADLAGLGIAQGTSTSLIALSMFVLASNSIPLSPGQSIGMACYGLARLMTFGNFFSNIGKRFGYQYYGQLVGIGLLFSAVLSLIQYPLITAAASGHETIVNTICGVLVLCTMPYCVWLALVERKVP